MRNQKSLLPMPRVLAALLTLALATPVLAALDLTSVTRHKLDNGLTVLLLEDRNFPVASVQMLYRVGARNEVTGKTGLAHFLEHMAFRATERYPDTEVVSRIYAVGGEWHGYTWTDQTTYFATVPGEHLDLLLDIEAERMGALVLDPDLIEPERGAVLAELHMYENDPQAMLLDALVYTSFLAHPYRNNTIGWEDDIDSISHADVLDFYEAHYHPANAVLAVVGDFDSASALGRIETLFADLERHPPTPLPHTREPEQQGERRIVTAGALPDHRFMIAYRAPAASHPDYAAFLVLQEVLAGSSGASFLQNDWGTESRPGRMLHGVAPGLSTWFPPSADEYLFVIGGGVGEGQTEASIEADIEARLGGLRDETPSTATVNGAIDAVFDELVYDIETTEDAAHQLSYFEGLGALDVLLTLPERVAAVAAADVQRVARTYLRTERRTIAWYRQAEPSAGNATATTDVAIEPTTGTATDSEPVGEPRLQRLTGGLPVIVMASDLSPSVEIAVTARGVPVGVDEFAVDDPEIGSATWRTRGRPAELEQLVRSAAAAIAAARPDVAGRAPESVDPSTRLWQEQRMRMRGEMLSPNDELLPAVVVVAGDVDPDITVDLLDRHFGEFIPGAIPAYERSTGITGRHEVRLAIPVAQAQLGYLVAAPAPGTPDFLAWQMLQYIFAHGYEGRLGKEAISRRGLAYYIDAQLHSSGGPAWTALGIGVDPAKADALEALLDAELQRLEREPPTAAEVEEAKRYLLGRAVSAAQSNTELTRKLARHWLRYETTPSVPDLEQQLAAITRGDVLALVPAFRAGAVIAVTP